MLIVIVCVAGCKKSSTEIVSPNGNLNNSDVRVTTYTPQDITYFSAVCGGDAIVTQGLSLTEIGVCWSENHNPTTNESYVSTEVWSEPFVYTITNLSPNTKYYVRAYALRGLEFYYGEEKSFVTENCSTVLDYNDLDTIHIVLRDNYQIQVSSDYPIIYTIIDDNPNFQVIRVSNEGMITGLNVGTAKLNISNGYNEITVDVIVDLFQEPTFEFGCNTNRIKELYGNPYHEELINDTVLVYLYTGPQGYSYACGEMDIWFTEGLYHEADIYVRSSLEYLMNNYLNDNFDLETIIGDTLSIYRNKFDNTVICGKYASHNIWDEWLLFYIRADVYKSIEAVMKERQKWSKQFGEKR